MRIVFSEIVIEQPHLILFDEPTNHLDLETIDALIEGINEYNGSIVTITHNIDLIERTESDVYLLCNAQLDRLDSINDYIETIINEDKV
jgi:ATPase subunit of ABC transporter with duplicated ATPase domains